MKADARRVQLRKAIGERLRDSRSHQERSQAAVARSSGISQSALSNYEASRCELPLIAATRVTASLGISIADIIDEHEMLAS